MDKRRKITSPHFFYIRCVKLHGLVRSTRSSLFLAIYLVIIIVDESVSGQTLSANRTSANVTYDLMYLLNFLVSRYKRWASRSSIKPCMLFADSGKSYPKSGFANLFEPPPGAVPYPTIIPLSLLVIFA